MAKRDKQLPPETESLCAWKIKADERCQRHSRCTSSTITPIYRTTLKELPKEQHFHRLAWIQVKGCHLSPSKSRPRESLEYLEGFQTLRLQTLKMPGIFGSSSSTAAQARNTLGDLSKDVPLENPPEDSISDVLFYSQSDHLAVASWNNKVRIYEITPDKQSQPRAIFEHKGPVLSRHWSKVCRRKGP